MDLRVRELRGGRPKPPTGAGVTRRIVTIGVAAAALWLCSPPFSDAGFAQTPAVAAPAAHPPSAVPPPKPATGFVSTYEIMRTVRAAGFHPLSRPLREGASYVLRATDFRGVPMRVVLDARTGVIRDATRIVPASAGLSGAPPNGRLSYPYLPPATQTAPAASLQ